MRRSHLLAAIVLLTLAGRADAHARLVVGSPAPNATTASPTRVELRFSERLMPAFSKAELTMANRSRAKLAGISAVAPDGRTLVFTPKARLGAGRYDVAWRVVSMDTHRVACSYAPRQESGQQ